MPCARTSQKSCSCRPGCRVIQPFSEEIMMFS
jgi:hypothetical protein